MKRGGVLKSGLNGEALCGRGLRVCSPGHLALEEVLKVYRGDVKW